MDGLAAALVGNYQEGLDRVVDQLPECEFWKMSGSGNDFVFFDAREKHLDPLESPAAIRALCARKTGIGADGVVFVVADSAHAFGIRYYNRDGSLAELCGNASLCAVALAREWGLFSDSGKVTFGTTSGPVVGRMRQGVPEIELRMPEECTPEFPEALRNGEWRIGYAKVGVPHLVVFCADVQLVPVRERGRELRSTAHLPAGANVNFVSESGGGWIVRTFERGVEAETLACGSGAVATASMLKAWGLQNMPVRLRTRSGAFLEVDEVEAQGQPLALLRGEGRIVFTGRLRALPIAS